MKFPSLRRKNPNKVAAENLYAVLSDQARLPVFYQDLGVPDTIDGRFDMVVLHGILLMRRLKAEGDQARDLSQCLFDTVFKSFDGSLRQMGVGDLSVGKRVKKMAEAFYGRVDAYETPLAEGDNEALKKAIIRNLYREEVPDEKFAQVIAGYMLSAVAELNDTSLEQLWRGAFEFPAVEMSEQVEVTP